MNVQELIERLQDCDPNALVIFNGFAVSSRLAELEKVEECQIKFDANGNRYIDCDGDLAVILS